MTAPHPRANPRARRAARISTPRRRLLDHTGCVELLDLWLEAYATLETLRARPFGRHLRRLPVPTLLSESIAALHCTKILGQPASASEGIDGHDLRVRTDCDLLDVEVKGSTADWITITSTDRTADTVIWLDFCPLLGDRLAAVIARVYASVADLPDRVRPRQAPEVARLVELDPRAPAQSRCDRGRARAAAQSRECPPESLSAR